MYLQVLGGGAAAGAGSPTTSIAGIYFLGLQMARKYKINDETMALTERLFVLARLFSPITLKWSPRSMT